MTSKFVTVYFMSTGRMERSHIFKMQGMHVNSTVIWLCIETVKVPAEVPEEYTDNTFARRPDFSFLLA